VTWIDEELDKQRRREELCGHATELRNAVWREIQTRVEEARSKVPVAAGLIVGDEIRFPQLVDGGAPATLTVKVGSDGCSIESSNRKKFPLGYNGDSPSLTRSSSDNTPISIEQAAREILQPFLFGK
jgi:hypothetical protein